VKIHPLPCLQHASPIDSSFTLMTFGQWKPWSSSFCNSSAFGYKTRIILRVMHEQSRWTGSPCVLDHFSDTSVMLVASSLLTGVTLCCGLYKMPASFHVLSYMCVKLNGFLCTPDWSSQQTVCTADNASV
jgi:hypothetical protein